MVSDTEYYEGLWSYYQDFCKTHNATGITDLVVQRDNAIAKIAELEAKLAKYENLEPVAWRCFDGEGGYDYRSYVDNENYRNEFLKRNTNPIYKSWVEPLYTLEK